MSERNVNDPNGNDTGMSCTRCQENLVAYLEGLLDMPQASDFTSHLQTCPQCQAEVDQLRQLRDRLVTDGEMLTRESVPTRVMDEIFQQQTFHIRRITMQKRYGKTGIGLTAAAIAAVIVMALTFINTSPNGSGAAWAIEQTVAALREANTAHFKGAVSVKTPEGELSSSAWEMWWSDTLPGNALGLPTRAPGMRIKGKYMPKGCFNPIGYIEGMPASVKNMPTIAVSKSEADGPFISFRMISALCGSGAFRYINHGATDWHEENGQDEKSGSPCVFVTFNTEELVGVYEDGQLIEEKPVACSHWIQFNLETKLPMRIKQWNSPNCDGTPVLDIDEISYNCEIPAEIMGTPSK